MRFKRLTGIALALVILCSLSSIALASGDSIRGFSSQYADAINVITTMNNNRSFKIDSVAPLIDLNGNIAFSLLVFKDSGYAIVDLADYTLVEALPDAQNPYSEATGILIYGGIFNYLYKTQDGRIFTVNGVEVSPAEIAQKKLEILTTKSNLQLSEDMQLDLRVARANPASAEVSYSSYIKNTMPIGNNVNGTCGSVAAGMMLTCFDAKIYTSGSVVPKSIGYGENLHTSLIPYVEDGDGSGSTSASIKSGIVDWLDDETSNSNDLTAKYVYLIQEGYAESQIADDKVCVFACGDILGSPWGNHIVMAWGYYSNSNGDYFNVHLGWTGSSNANAIMNSNWSIGVTWLEEE